MTIHLTTRTGSACGSLARVIYLTAVLNDADCTRCLRLLNNLKVSEPERIAAARYEAQRVTAVHAVGLDDVWAFAADDSPTGRMLRNIIAALAIGLHEMGYAPPSGIEAAS